MIHLIEHQGWEVWMNESSLPIRGEGICLSYSQNKPSALRMALDKIEQEKRATVKLHKQAMEER